MMKNGFKSRKPSYQKTIDDEKSANLVMSRMKKQMNKQKIIFVRLL